MWIRRAGCRLAASITTRSLPLFGKIALIIFALHGLLLAALTIHHLASSSKSKATRPLTVRIHHSVPAPPLQQTTIAPKAKSSPAKKPALAPPKKHQNLPVKRRAVKTVDAEQLLEIGRALATFETSVQKKKCASSLSLPRYLESSLEASVEEISGNSLAASYGPTLAGILQQQLQLPERGDVRIRLVLEAPGKIRALEILDSKSTKNAQWLKNQLPLLELPCFNDFGICAERMDFTVTFRNVEKN